MCPTPTQINSTPESPTPPQSPTDDVTAGEPCPTRPPAQQATTADQPAAAGEPCITRPPLTATHPVPPATMTSAPPGTSALKQSTTGQHCSQPDHQPPATVTQQHADQVNTDCYHIDIDFDHIRDWCEIDVPTENNITPQHLAAHRKVAWPEIGTNAPMRIQKIYQAVRATGLQNHMGARVPLDSEINIGAWRDLATLDREDQQLIDLIQFGFPLGYNGPAMHTSAPINHQSAFQYPTHISDFIREELDHGALIGPLHEPMFTQWQHISPMMTRPKSDPLKRRIITDLSFPPPRVN